MRVRGRVAGLTGAAGQGIRAQRACSSVPWTGRNGDVPLAGKGVEDLQDPVGTVEQSGDLVGEEESRRCAKPASTPRSPPRPIRSARWSADRHQGPVAEPVIEEVVKQLGEVARQELVGAGPKFGGGPPTPSRGTTRVADMQTDPLCWSSDGGQHEKTRSEQGWLQPGLAGCRHGGVRG